MKNNTDKVVKTKIDEIKSWYDEYVDKPESCGKLLHYIYCICGLTYADSVIFHGNGIVKLNGNLFATANYDKGYPYFTFAAGFERFQEKQDKLLKGE